MREETLYELETPYRQKFRIKGFRFGEGEKVCAMVAAVCGNEVQQMYVCALLVKKLHKLEEQGAIAPGNELLVVPCVNHFSMNVGSRFWATDKTNINRMFPGYVIRAKRPSALRRHCLRWCRAINTASILRPFICPAILCPMCAL